MRDGRTTLLLQYVAGNVRQLRRRRNLTQEELAERAGLDLTTEQRIERASVNLSVGVLGALADALGVAPGLLLRKATAPTIKRGRPMKKSKRSR
jgi:transcriptional regulator with XRE-family HTH domain